MGRQKISLSPDSLDYNTQPQHIFFFVSHILKDSQFSCCFKSDNVFKAFVFFNITIKYCTAELWRRYCQTVRFWYSCVLNDCIFTVKSRRKYLNKVAKLHVIFHSSGLHSSVLVNMPVSSLVGHWETVCPFLNTENSKDHVLKGSQFTISVLHVSLFDKFLVCGKVISVTKTMFIIHFPISVFFFYLHPFIIRAAIKKFVWAQ